MERNVLLLVFFFSGFASLVYQVAWQRLLTLYWGVGSVSTTIIVSVYMLGLGAGALIGGLCAEKFSNRIRFYFYIELAIGLFGVISLPFLQLLAAQTAGAGTWLSFLVIFLFLCVPTMLMGITLPVLIKIFTGIRRDFIHVISYLYFINTIGAAAGCLTASFVFITLFGLDRAVYIAAAINCVLALMIAALSARPQAARQEQPPDVSGHNIPGAEEFLGRAGLFLVFVSGFLAIGYEIIWFRLMSILTKASAYNFSSSLGVYLAGIALGSYGMKFYLDKRPALNRRHLFFGIQAAVALSVWASVFVFYLTLQTPLRILTEISFTSNLHPPLDLLPLDTSSLSWLSRTLVNGFYVGDFILWPMYFIFVPALFIGASFPLIAFLCSGKPGHEASVVARVYFFNILGNVLGGIVTGFVFLPFLGTERTLALFIAAGMLLGGWSLLPRSLRLGLMPKGALIAGVLFCMFLFFPARGDLYRQVFRVGTSMITGDIRQEEEFFEEGVEGVVYAQGSAWRLINFIDGVGHGWRPALHFYHKTIEAVSHTRQQEKVLVIGYGTGTTPEVLLDMPSVRNITLVEINRTLMKNITKIDFFREMLTNPRLKLVIDDARRFLLGSKERYDLVLMDPLHATTVYSNNLHSAEFFELIRQHLAPEGVLLIWSNEYQIIPRTLHEVFPFVRLYGSFCLASVSPLRLDVTLKESLLAMYPDDVQNEIRRFEQIQEGDSAGNLVGDQAYIREKFGKLPVNRDYRPRTEYYLRKVYDRLFNAVENR
jgi:predicted membrane-bound spermidine synthase